MLLVLQIERLREMTILPRRSDEGPFLMSIDHCFPIKGQGTVLTGTILSGCVKVNETVEIPELKLQKKVKSLQVMPLLLMPSSCSLTKRPWWHASDVSQAGDKGSAG